MIAKVIVNIPSSNIDQLFDYLIPPEFCDFASVGIFLQPYIKKQENNFIF